MLIIVSNLSKVIQNDPIQTKMILNANNLLAAVVMGWTILDGGFIFISSDKLLFLSKSLSWIWSLDDAVANAGAAVEVSARELLWIIFATVTVGRDTVFTGAFVTINVVPRFGSWFSWFSTKVVAVGGCWQKNIIIEMKMVSCLK